MKPTSLAAQLKRTDEADRLANDKADAAVAALAPEPGKVWVRLIRPFYDSNGVLHEAGLRQLDEGAVPKTGKILTNVEAAEQAEAEEEDEA